MKRQENLVFQTKSNLHNHTYLSNYNYKYHLYQVPQLSDSVQSILNNLVYLKILKIFSLQCNSKEKKFGPLQSHKAKEPMGVATYISEYRHRDSFQAKVDSQLC